ncbi:MAG: GMC family oxidoreductase N-terminal domain-containing protein [Rhodobacter sp.]|uniref:GMC family oxidoreductase n=1 Tax=Pararhodobacter sp. TaxID=2127056 RepID=UPI001D5EABD6|nr:GMC family oxidoreductase N-terminal domain-containing protein [Pararhodobacter sp.]MCB1344035.1 GMC family oxidoreductase N-terminal domain-containing protein [Paracoccaceae bacterium]MCC0074908.1 GMC family oxidoreductase N-terminal domain-containing protein [Rhodobacter sp.]HPD94104.1 GMC family oxidoreductase N-terminal domain-containing protein [Pararhodobacter sp.]
MRDAEFDFVIVGAGTAGAALANRLSADPATTVLLLEAGGDDRSFLIRMPLGFLKALGKPRFTWGFQTEPEPHLNGRVLPVPRGRLLGGSSSINGMFHIRGHRADYDEWRDDFGCEGWGYADVLPFFKRSETNFRGETEYHGGSGPIHVREIDTTHLLEAPLRQAAVAAGYGETEDYDGAKAEGFARGQVAIDPQGRRDSSARAYLRPIVGRPNLTILTQALARRVIVEGARATGVAFDHKGQTRRVTARREVILSGGAYNSPQLLMLSGIGPAAELQALGIAPVHDLPGVGRNLIEHPRMAMLFKATKPVTFLRELRLDRAVRHVLNWALRGKGAFANQISTGTILLRTRPDLDRPDVQLLCNPIALTADLWFPGWRKAGTHAFYITVCLLRQKSRGTVTLRSADPTAKPVIRMNLLDRPEDRETFRGAVRAVRRIYRTEPQGDLTGEELIPGGAHVSDDDLDAALRQHVAITHHPVGTCRMGHDPLAVVDPRLRVHGIAGLRVVDASIMPTIIGGNTNAPTLMIAEKGAEMILADTRQGTAA